MGRLGMFAGVLGMHIGLPGVLGAFSVIAFAVMFGCGAVRLRRRLVMIGSFGVGVFRHWFNPLFDTVRCELMIFAKVPRA